MNLDYTKIFGIIDKSPLSEEEKSAWKERIPAMSVEEIQRLWNGLHAETPDELNEMIVNERKIQGGLKMEFDGLVIETEKKVRGVREEASTEDDVIEEEKVLEELDNIA